MSNRMTLTVEFEREDDGRWIADIVQLPGVMAYGATQADALTAVKVLALRVLAEKIELNEIPRVDAFAFEFSTAA